MNRLPGVTFAGVLLIVGGTISILIMLIVIAALIVVQFSMSGDSATLTLLSYLLLDLTALGFAVWVFTTGVGLLRMRSWARISAVIFAALLVIGGLLGLLIVLFAPSFTPRDQSASNMRFVQVAPIIFYALLTIFAGWWLYYFKARRVKYLFLFRSFPIAQPLAVQPLVVEPLSPALPAKMKRPISISLIAALMLIGAGMAPFSLIFLAVMKFPVPFFGLWLSGWQGAAVLILTFGLLLAAGMGLLKLKPWARNLSICYTVFLIINYVVSFGLPGSAAHFQQVMTTMMNRFIPPNALPADAKDMFASFAHMASSSVFMGMVFGVLVDGVQLWFLIKEKPAFLVANQSEPNIS